jgi:hypothetical protein
MENPARAALFLAALILLHHYIIHPELSRLERFAQKSDLGTHETWVVACLSFAVGSSLKVLSRH